MAAVGLGSIFENPDVFNNLLACLPASGVANVTSSCRSARRHATTYDDSLWTHLYEHDWRRVVSRSPADASLRVAQLYSRMASRRAFKLAPQAMDLVIPEPPGAFPRTTLNDAAPPLEWSGSTASESHRTRSRGSSMDVVAPTDAPKQPCAGASRPQVAHVGAMRFVSVPRPNLVIGSSDQGHLAAWYVPSLRPAGQAPSAQCDLFSTSVDAKSRRDAKRKYSQKFLESKFVYFKIHAANISHGGESEAGMPETAFDVWGGGGPSGAIEAAETPPRDAGGEEEQEDAALAPDPHSNASTCSEHRSLADELGSQSEDTESDSRASAGGSHSSHDTARRRARHSDPHARLFAADMEPLPEARAVTPPSPLLPGKGQAKWSESDKLRWAERESRRREKKVSKLKEGAGGLRKARSLSGASDDGHASPRSARTTDETAAVNSALDTAGRLASADASASASACGGLPPLDVFAQALLLGVTPPNPASSPHSGAISLAVEFDTVPSQPSPTALASAQRRSPVSVLRDVNKSPSLHALSLSTKDARRMSPEASTPSPRGGPPSPSPTLTASKSMPSPPTSLALTAKPLGSKQRPDIWFAYQWVRHERPALRRQTSTPRAALPSPIPTRPLNSGNVVSLHAVIAFPDGDLGVVSPQSISTKAGDRLLCPKVTDHSSFAAAHASLCAGEGEMGNAMHIRPSPAPRKGVQAATPAWPQQAVAWLERPPGEDRMPIAAVAVCGGGEASCHYTAGDTPSLATTVTTVATAYDNVTAPDLILGAFGRAVAVWLYCGTQAVQATTGRSRMGAGAGEAAIESDSAKLPTPGSNKKSLRRGLSAETAASVFVKEGPAPSDLDERIAPILVFRTHTHAITCVDATRLIADEEAATIAGAVPPSAPAVTAVSGDAGGNICMWDAGTGTRLASLTLHRRGGREAVAVVRISSEFVVAGGAEGAVAVWRRRRRGLLALGAGTGDVAPELLLREVGAHDIVRCVWLPPPTCGVSGILTGGGDGDVRLWICPTTAKSTLSLSPLRLAAAHEAPGTCASDTGVGSVSGRHHTSVSAAISAPAPTTAYCKLLKGHTARVTGLHMDNNKVTTSSLDGSVKIWDLQEPHVGRLLQTVRLPSEASSLSVLGQTITVGTVDGRVILYEFRDSRGSSTGHAITSAISLVRTARSPPVPVRESPAGASSRRRSDGTGGRNAAAARSLAVLVRDASGASAGTGLVESFSAYDLQMAYDNS